MIDFKVSQGEQLKSSTGLEHLEESLLSNLETFIVLSVADHETV